MFGRPTHRLCFTFEHHQESGWTVLVALWEREQLLAHVEHTMGSGVTSIDFGTFVDRVLDVWGHPGLDGSTEALHDIIAEAAKDPVEASYRARRRKRPTP